MFATLLTMMMVFAICQAGDADSQLLYPDVKHMCVGDNAAAQPSFLKLVDGCLAKYNGASNENIQKQIAAGCAKAITLATEVTVDGPPEQRHTKYMAKCKAASFGAIAKEACAGFFMKYPTVCKQQVSVAAAAPLVADDCNGFSVGALGLVAITSTALTFAATKFLSGKGDASKITLLDDEF